MQPLTLNRYAYTANNPLMYQDPSGHSVIKLGSRGQSVKELQQLLVSSGYNGLKVDGIFGKGTLSAVIAYQTSKGLGVDGIVGSQTWGALRNTYTSNPTLRKGSRGGAVTELQQGLMRLDYLGPYGADGVFGNQTERAVKEFQRMNGLDPDGVVGKQTWAALAQKKVISNNRNNCGGGNKGTDNHNTLIERLKSEPSNTNYQKLLEIIEEHGITDFTYEVFQSIVDSGTHGTLESTNYILGNNFKYLAEYNGVSSYANFYVLMVDGEITLIRVGRVKRKLDFTTLQKLIFLVKNLMEEMQVRLLMIIYLLLAWIQILIKIINYQIRTISFMRIKPLIRVRYFGRT